MQKNYKDNQHWIEGYWAQMENAWSIGKYYEAGNVGGVVDTYLFALPGPAPTKDYPGNAARDFYSGVIFGWMGMDVKADMDTCFPDDTELAGMIENNYRAWETRDWQTVMDVGQVAS